jgi:hypothetical protein
MSSIVRHHRPRQSAPPPSGARANMVSREGNDARLVGVWVQVERGVAARVFGYVRECHDGRATLLATVLAGRPVVLTVDAADCAPIEGGLS